MCPLECIWIDGMVYLWLRPPFWQTMAVIEMSFCSNRISMTKNSWCHTLHHVRNWVDRGQKAPLPKPLWGGCMPGPLVTLCPTLSDFQIYCQIRFLRFSSGDPNNRITKYSGDPNNWITKYSVIWVTRITEFGDSGEFGWVRMPRIWRASKPHSANGL
jgi:hypothetical protein